MGNSEKKTKILVADDSLTIQKVIRLALSNEPFEIETASNGQEALERIPLFRPDIVIVDVGLPEVSALELREKGSADGQKVQFVLMSSSYDEQKLDPSSVDLFDGQLSKPFDPGHLRDVLEKCVANAQKSNLKKTVSREPEPTIQSTPVPPPFRPSEFEEDVSHRVTINELEESPPREAEESKADLSADLWSDHSSEGIDDVEQLAQETLHMNSSNDFDWSVEDSSQSKRIPSIQPRYLDEAQANSLTDAEPSLPPLPKQRQADSTFQLEDYLTPPPQTEKQSFLKSEEITLENSNPFELGMNHSPSDKPIGGVQEEDPSPVPLNQAQIEELISQQLQQTVQKMAKDLLPDIAERIIKSEINKLLSDPPSNS